MPIIKEQSPAGVLFATIEAENIFSSMGITFFNDKGSSYIVANDGSVLMTPNPQETGESFYKILESQSVSDAEKNGVLELETRLKSNASSAMRLSIGGKDLYCAYACMEGINNDDLNTLCLIASDYVFGGISTVVRYTVFFCLVLSLIFLLITFISVNTQRKASSRLYHLAYIDSLTGLYNYKKLCIESDQARANHPDQNFAAICFDISHFKIINDTFGHSFGDYLLTTIAQDLRSLLAGKALYGRLSNDNFAIFTFQTDKQNIVSLIHKISQNLDEEMARNEKAIHIDLNFGIHVSSFGTKEDIVQIFDKADLVRKSLKNDRHDFYAFFEDSMLQQITRETTLQSQMQKAMATCQFEVYYQPQIDLSTNKICGVEALIRWKHPEKGFISPAEFIPVAEKCGFIREIGRYVFIQVCEDMAAWKKKGIRLPVCVNISRTELYQPQLAEYLHQYVRRYGLVENQFELELTETVATTDLNFMSEIAAQFKSYGFQLAMDDFGTGYSSLGCLKNLPFDVLKLDRSFLTDLNSDPKAGNIIQSMIQLAKSLELKIISEGVETKEEVQFLMSVGCDIAQGFYYARPMPKAEALQLILQSPFAPELQLGKN